VYRDFRAVIACCLPLTVGTFIGYWFMKELQIGLTVATLPVMVLAVGIGVDYAFYIYNRLQLHMASGQPIVKALEHSILEVGTATIFTAITLAAAWRPGSFSELKFQADMGKLLAFMFMVNMVMAMTALPAFAVWLEKLLQRSAFALALPCAAQPPAPDPAAGPGPQDPLTSVSFVDERRGWAVGHWGVVLHTADGGETWQLQRSDTRQDRPLFAVHFFDANQGVAVGLWSLVLVTSDSGAHWQSVQLEPPAGSRRADLNLLGLFSDAGGRLFAPAEKGMVLRSDDRGRHWRYLSTGYTGSFWTGVAPVDGALLVAGLRGSMYRSADEGRTWQRIDTHSKSSITALATTGARVVAVGLDGLILRSADSGASFTPDTRGDRLPLTAVVFDKQEGTVLYSRQGVVPGDSANASSGK
jgi:photosystem II stability/assembly factor-like uncharacterized protein